MWQKKKKNSKDKLKDKNGELSKYGGVMKVGIRWMKGERRWMKLAKEHSNKKKKETVETQKKETFESAAAASSSKRLHALGCKRRGEQDG